MNIRTVILSLALVVVLTLAVPLVTARTAVASNPASDSVAVADNSQEAATQHKAPIPSYRSRFDVCFDVPLSEAAACRAEGQTLMPSYRSRLDECFDVSLSELASCRSAGQSHAP
jgi:hypothetical protein